MSTAERPLSGARLAGWWALVGLLALVSYASRAAGAKPPRDALYHWSTAVGAVAQYAVMLALVLAIAIGPGMRDRLALRRPRSWLRALGLCVGVLVVVSAVGYALEPVLHADREQGLTPAHWEPAHAAAYAANFAVLALAAPLVEELLFRGVGYTLLAPLGDAAAIAVTAVAFALAHGLVEGLPVLALLGAGLAYLRARTGSVWPGMLLHAAWNTIALVTVVA